MLTIDKNNERKRDMKKISMLIALCMIPLLHACEPKELPRQTKTESRTMIIGGMPVHDRDYMRSGQHSPEKILADQVVVE